jgi:hypothetical protein
VGTTVAVGILLVLCLAVALVFYWRYREEESLYLQVGSQSIQLVLALQRNRYPLPPGEFVEYTNRVQWRHKNKESLYI